MTAASSGLLRTPALRRAVAAVAAGLLAGVLSGLMGVGGGVLLVPAMALLLGFEQHKAHGTSLAVIVPIAALGSFGYYTHGSINWAVSVQLALGGILGAGMGARLAEALPSRRLRRLFALFVLLVAIKMIYDAAPAVALNAEMVVAQGHISSAWFVLVTGLAAGVLSGLMGVGGGIIMVPALVYLLGFDQRTAQGISLLVIVPISISGAAAHYIRGNVDIPTGKWLALGGVAGSYAGAQAAHQFEDATLRLVFGVFLLLMSALTFRRR